MGSYTAVRKKTGKGNRGKFYVYFDGPITVKRIGENLWNISQQKYH
jgi:hypothetical protein